MEFQYIQFTIITVYQLYLCTFDVTKQHEKYIISLTMHTAHVTMTCSKVVSMTLVSAAVGAERQITNYLKITGSYVEKISNYVDGYFQLRAFDAAN